MPTPDRRLDPSRFDNSLTADGRYRLLIQAVTDYAIYMLDPDGTVTSWNPGARRFKGYEEAEIVGQHFSRFYTEEDRASGLPERALAAAREEGKFEGEGWRVRKTGERFWASVIIDPVRDPAGNLVGYAKITRDLTERKAAEEILRKTEEQLQAARAERHRLLDLSAERGWIRLQLERRSAAHQRIPPPGNHRPALLDILYRGRPPER